MKHDDFHGQDPKIILREHTVLARVAALALLAAVFASVACAQVTVTISPASASAATLATQVFTATVSGTTNTGVSWQVNGVAGGNASAGLISTTIGGTNSEALYLGPAAVPSPTSVTVTAVSQADSTKSASATVTIQSPS